MLAAAFVWRKMLAAFVWRMMLAAAFFIREWCWQQHIVLENDASSSFYWRLMVAAAFVWRMMLAKPGNYTFLYSVYMFAAFPNCIFYVRIRLLTPGHLRYNVPFNEGSSYCCFLEKWFWQQLDFPLLILYSVQCTLAPDPVNDVGISLTITQFMCIFAYILEEGGRFVI